MIRFAEQNAAGKTNAGAGTRYDRGRPGSIFCSAASEMGAKAYMMAVAAVMTLTKAAQLLKGPNASRPTNVDRIIEPTGTPFALVRVNTDGSSRSSPSAYDRRA